MIRQIRTFLTAAVLSIPGIATAQDSFIHVDDRPFLELVGGVEGKSSYNTVTLRTRLQPPFPLTKMTIGEIIDFQQLVIDSGASSSAMGKYQFIQKTLVWLVDSKDISRHTMFNQATQDYLARLLMFKCGFYDRGNTTDDVGNCLSRAWAGLPVMTGKRAGRSYYPGNGNKSLTSVAAMHSVLMNRFMEPGVIVISLND